MANIAPIEVEGVRDARKEDNELNTDGKRDKVAIESVNATPLPSKKKVIIERLILCTALFFPLFLATLDTSISTRNIADFSNRRNRIASYL